VRLGPWHSRRVALTRIYLSPGMFGFAELASLDYFGHLRRGLIRRFHARKREAQVLVCEVHPTASIRRRGAKLAALIRASCMSDDGPIHIIGHSTGGLDARIVASPSSHLGTVPALLEWLPRLCSITTINPPHYGTPLAAFFATVSGQRVLYALSALTVAVLKLGALPMATASALFAAFGRVQFGDMELRFLESTIDKVIRVLDEAASRELRAWLKQLRDDQGAIVQLMPEAMDLFQAGVRDREGVRYQSVATYAPAPRAKDWIAALRSPWGAASAAIFTALYTLTARLDERYPCGPSDGSAERLIKGLTGEQPPPEANDGVVPLASQVWGDLIWCGKGDHLDVVGHFASPTGHHDWLTSGAAFSLTRFDVIIDQIVAGMLVSEERGAAKVEGAA
jgi:triacylglycerol lipase